MPSDKQSLRRECRRRLTQTSADAVSRASACVCHRLQALACVEAAGCCVVYAALAEELDLAPLAAHLRARGVVTAYPRYVAAQGGYEPVRVDDPAADLVPGRYGIAEPRPTLPRAAGAAAADAVWLVPALAFDRAGHRLGRGGGFYDRMLTATDGTVIGVAFDWQIMTQLPVEPHDRGMHMLVSDKRVLDCRGALDSA